MRRTRYRNLIIVIAFPKILVFNETRQKWNLVNEEDHIHFRNQVIVRSNRMTKDMKELKDCPEAIIL